MDRVSAVVAGIVMSGTRMCGDDDKSSDRRCLDDIAVSVERCGEV